MPVLSRDNCDRPGGCDESHHWVVAIEISRPDSTCPNGEAPPPPGEPPTSIAVYQSEPKISSGTVQFYAVAELLGLPDEQVCVYAYSVETP